MINAAFAALHLEADRGKYGVDHVLEPAQPVMLSSNSTEQSFCAA